VVLGGDQNVGPPRCVEHAWQLRDQIRRRVPDLTLGGWANPHGDCASQVGHLLDEHANAEFYLTQIVSHHSQAGVERFLSEGARRGLAAPGLFGLFYYRSANARTLSTLSGFLPVPVEELRREFAGGATPEEVCARSLRTLTAVGARHFYISNLPLGRADLTLRKILTLAAAA
jgi:hypothetical protein